MTILRCRQKHGTTASTTNEVCLSRYDHFVERNCYRTKRRGDDPARAGLKTTFRSARIRWRAEPTSGQVFWLPDHTTDRAFPSKTCSVASAVFVPGYSGGTATDSHRLPYSSVEHSSTDTHVVAKSYRAVFHLQAIANGFHARDLRPEEIEEMVLAIHASELGTVIRSHFAKRNAKSKTLKRTTTDNTDHTDKE